MNNTGVVNRRRSQTTCSTVHNCSLENLGSELTACPVRNKRDLSKKEPTAALGSKAEAPQMSALNHYTGIYLYMNYICSI